MRIKPIFSELLIAARFLIQGSKKITSLSVFALLAIGVGIWALGSLLSVMYGFEFSLTERVLRAHPHLMVKSKNGFINSSEPQIWLSQFDSNKDIYNKMPFFEGEMIARSKYRTLGVVVRGIPESELIKISSNWNHETRFPKAVLGSELAVRLGVSEAETIRVISPFEKEGLLGVVPRWEVFEVVSEYTSGHYDFDQQYLFTSLNEAQLLFKKQNKISGYQFWLRDLSKLEVVKKELTQFLQSDWEISTWQEYNQALFQSLKLEQLAMFLILSFAILMACLNMVIVLLMQVNHKKKQIGILRALGASSFDIQKIFIWMGALIGGAGLLLGTLLTGLTLVILKKFNWFTLPSIYYDRTIPVQFRLEPMLLIYGFSVVFILIATWYPSSQAAKLDPIVSIKES